MRFLRPVSWPEALAGKAAHPDAVPIAGGTDVMAGLNLGRIAPGGLLDLSAVPELREWSVGASSVPGSCGVLRLGAGVTHARLAGGPAGADRPGRLGAPGGPAGGDHLGRPERPGRPECSGGPGCPGGPECAAGPHRAGASAACAVAPLVCRTAARTAGPPQVRARGTIGGNLGSASPAGDLHPPLLAVEAEVEVESAARGVRVIPVDAFLTGPGQTALAPDELIRAVRVPLTSGPQGFAKIGVRNVTSTAVCSFALVLDPAVRGVATGAGAAGPTALRAVEAEEFAAKETDWEAPLPPGAARHFGRLVAAAAHPADDAHGTARYRGHALSVLAARALTRLWPVAPTRSTSWSTPWR